MANGSSNSSVRIVAIIAVIVLVAFVAWFLWGRSGGSRRAPTTTGASSDADIKIKVDLPDTITIKP